MNKQIVIVNTNEKMDQLEQLLSSNQFKLHNLIVKFDSLERQSDCLVVQYNGDDLPRFFLQLSSYLLFIGLKVNINYISLHTIGVSAQ